MKLSGDGLQIPRFADKNSVLLAILQRCQTSSIVIVSFFLGRNGIHDMDEFVSRYSLFYEV